MSNKTLCIFSVGSVVLGALVYAATRTDILFLNWMGIKGHVIDTNGHPLLYWVVYNLPDGLWYFALLCAEMIFYCPNLVWSKVFWYISILLPFAIEFGQLMGWCAGTFDWLDLATYFIVLILFLLVWKRKHFF